MAAAVVPAELGAFIESGQRAIDGAERALEYLANKAADKQGLRGERLVEPLSEVKLHAPYARKARIMMAGGNYIVHSQGMSLRGADGERMGLDDVYKQSRAKGIWGFYCFPENAAGPDEDMIYPARTDRLDYEGEVAVILGKSGKDIAASDAPGYYWGYMLQNDISARTNIPAGATTRSRASPAARTSTPRSAGGPCIVVGEFPDAQNISWETRVNGEVRQTGNTEGHDVQLRRVPSSTSRPT